MVGKKRKRKRYYQERGVEKFEEIQWISTTVQ